MNQLSRRHFVQSMTAACVVAGGGSAAQARQSITSREVVSRIHAQLQSEGVRVAPPGEATDDTFKLGNPDRPISGIATTWMATLEVLQRAHAAGCSMVITHEPTFYDAADATDHLQNDPVYRAKTDYALERNMCVWRFHDHIHRRRPDPIFKAFGDKIGLHRANPANQTAYSVQPVRLDALVEVVGQRLQTPNLRFVGNPGMMVSHPQAAMHFLGNIAGKEDVDVWLWPEPKEFNTFEYFRDASELGIPKAMIGMTHELWEDWGMLEPCAQWLKRFIPEVPVVPLRTAEFYWAET